MHDYNIHLVASANYRINFSSGKDPLKLKGLGKMVQILAKLLLSNFNEDLYDFEKAGNIRSDANEEPRYLRSDEGITELALLCMDRIRSIYLEEQLEYGIEDPDEQLREIKLRRAYIDWENERGVIEYEVYAISGEQAVFNLLVDSAAPTLDVTEF